MNSTKIKIAEIRKSKGLTQEELAELAKVNLRTIQRIENNSNTPRQKTLNLIYRALEIDVNKDNKIDTYSKSLKIIKYIFNILFLVLLNLIIITIVGFLTLDSEANLNSRLGAYLLSLFIPFTIVFFTQSMNSVKRLIQFGSGYIYYIMYLLYLKGIIKGFQLGLRTGLFFCLLISVFVLLYGSDILNYYSKKSRLD